MPLVCFRPKVDIHGPRASQEHLRTITGQRHLNWGEVLLATATLSHKRNCMLINYSYNSWILGEWDCLSVETVKGSISARRLENPPASTRIDAEEWRLLHRMHSPEGEEDLGSEFNILKSWRAASHVKKVISKWSTVNQTATRSLH